MRGVCAALAVLLALAAPVSAASVGKRVMEGYAGPSTSGFAQAAGVLATSTDALCARPDIASLDAARTAFAGALDGWAQVAALRFGPLATESRFERLFFWPDARGIGLKQVQALVAREDAASVATGLEGKSAAIQGFPALEFALFGAGAETLATGDPWRCRVAAAIASNIASIAGAVAAGWRPDTPFAASFASPSPGAEPYRSDAEVNGEIVKALATALQFVRGAEVLPPLGETPSKANGKRAPMWRSGLTAALIAAQVDAVRRLLTAAGYEDSLPEDSRYIASSIRFELENAIRALGSVESDPGSAFATEPDRGRFVYVDLALRHAGELVTRDLAAALGLTMGFNALDGD